jgi:hypothetical protein
MCNHKSGVKFFVIVFHNLRRGVIFRFVDSEYPREDNSSSGSLKHGAQLRTIWPIGLWPVLTTCNLI